MSEEIGILDLLKFRGFEPGKKAKLIRHQDQRYNIDDLIQTGCFDLYQSLQSKDVFKDLDYIIVFTGDGGTRARFLGVYRVLNGRKQLPSDVPPQFPHPEWYNPEGYAYELVEQVQFSDLRGRVVIEWGAGTLAWHQRIKNKPIIEIFPPGRVLLPFNDYLDFSLSYRELQQLMAAPEAHRDWKTSLSSVSGIYLILAETTGDLYVGSAYGLSGIWGRWQQYASNGHGNNHLLKQIINANLDYPTSFRYSILQVLPKSTRDKEVIRWETQYKRKLGSRATGLNAN